MNSLLKTFAILVIALASYFLNTSAFAQAAPTESSCANPNIQNPEVVALKKFPQIIKNTLGSNTTLSAFTGVGLEISGSTIPIARKIAGVILLITMLYAIALAMISNKPFGPVLVESALVAGIVSLLLAKYPTFINFATSLAEVLNSTVGSNLTNALYEMVNSVFTILSKVYDAIVTGNGCLAWYEILAKVVDMAVGLIFLAIAMILMILAFTEMLYVILLGPVLLAMGIAIGPLFMALIISKFTKPFFDRWLSFMFSAAILQYLALLLIKIMTKVMATATTISSSGSFAIHAIAIAVVAHMCAKIFKEIPGIASGMTGGKTGTMGGSANPIAAASSAAGAVGIGSAITAAIKSGMSAGTKASAAAAKSGAAASKTASNVVNRAGAPSK